jgi:hypothetical protein
MPIEIPILADVREVIDGKVVFNKKSFGTIKIPDSANTKLVVNIMPRHKSFAGFNDATHYEIKILPRGNIAVYGEYGTDLRHKIEETVDDEICRLGGIIREGEFWRATNNPEEIELLLSGALRPSTNYRTGAREIGLSVSSKANYEGTHTYVYKVRGDIVDIGSDGEPILDLSTLQPVSPLDTWGGVSHSLREMEKIGKEEFKKKYGWTDAQIQQALNGGYDKKMWEYSGLSS